MSAFQLYRDLTVLDMHEMLALYLKYSFKDRESRGKCTLCAGEITMDEAYIHVPDRSDKSTAILLCKRCKTLTIDF